ncbi:MAG: vitamin K epoxide reductase family protein [Rhodothermales bacterium]|nr:vitamin K epoxide reductase family protein [Rhodothermales bacterium]
MTADRNNKPERKLATYRPLLDGAMIVLGLLGILVVVHLWIQTGRSFDRGCFGFTAPENVTATVDCEAVISSDAGKLFGVSNIVWGLFYYLGVVGLSFLVLYSDLKSIRKKKKLRALIVLVGVLYSGYLSYVQYFTIGEFCKLCLISASIVMIMFILQLIDSFTKPDAGPKMSADNIARARKAPFFIALAGLIVVLAGADVMYFSGLEAAPPGASNITLEDGQPSECMYDPGKAFVENYREMVGPADPYKGNPESDVIVMEFFDPNCPHCKTMHPLVEALVQAHGDEAHFVYRPFILWEHSVVQVEALHIAAQEGLFFEMLEGQYALQRQEGLSLQTLEAIAEQIGLSKDLLRSRLERGLFRQVALRQRQNAIDAGVGSVPTVMINGRFVDRSSRTFDCLGELIVTAGE